MRVASRYALCGRSLLGALLALAVLCSTASAAPTNQENKPSGEQRFERLLQKGRTAYNAGDYKKAGERFLDLAQAFPGRPEPYRNLARTYFWQKRYARAGAFYDYYLKLAPEGKDLKKIKRERRLAAERAGDNVWQRPSSQTRVLDALRDALTDGHAYTEGGGGAWALYEALLRTGYVAPQLARIQERLRQRLVDEFEGLLVAESGQPVPILSLGEWQRQQMRLEAARSIADEPGVRKIIGRRMTIAEAALALLNGRQQDAAKLAAEAIDKNPDKAFLHWYRSVALVESDRPAMARKALDRFETRVEGSDRHQAYIDVLRALLAHRDGETKAAADAYRKILRE